jgi:hypothetical protein
MVRVKQSPTFSIHMKRLQEKWKKGEIGTTKKIVFPLTVLVDRIFRDRYFPSTSSNTTLAAGAGTAAGEERITPAVPMPCPSVEKLDKLLHVNRVGQVHYEQTWMAGSVLLSQSR